MDGKIFFDLFEQQPYMELSASFMESISCIKCLTYVRFELVSFVVWWDKNT